MEVDVEDNVSDEDIIKEVYNIGYEAKVYTKGEVVKSPKERMSVLNQNQEAFNDEQLFVLFYQDTKD